MEARAFLGTRRPPPPPALAAWLGGTPLDGPALEGLVEAGVAELRRARRPAPAARERAFPLLAADALVTYACEAALAEADPEAALRTLVRRAAAPEP